MAQLTARKRPRLCSEPFVSWKSLRRRRRAGSAGSLPSGACLSIKSKRTMKREVERCAERVRTLRGIAICSPKTKAPSVNSRPASTSDQRSPRPAEGHRQCQIALTGFTTPSPAWPGAGLARFQRTQRPQGAAHHEASLRELPAVPRSHIQALTHAALRQAWLQAIAQRLQNGIAPTNAATMPATAGAVRGGNTLAVASRLQGTQTGTNGTNPPMPIVLFGSR